MAKSLICGSPISFPFNMNGKRLKSLAFFKKQHYINIADMISILINNNLRDMMSLEMIDKYYRF